MLTIYRTMEASGETEMCGMSLKSVVEKGMSYHVQSIKVRHEIRFVVLSIYFHFLTCINDITQSLAKKLMISFTMNRVGQSRV
jgi:hypothetical protein